jgi:hypothetical protein
MLAALGLALGIGTVLAGTLSQIGALSVTGVALSVGSAIPLVAGISRLTSPDDSPR